MTERFRDAQGRFVANNPGGPGRPLKKREEKYLERFKKAVTLKEFEKASKKLLEMALAGDIRAIRTLFEYAIGKPAAYVEANVTQTSLSADLMLVIEKIYGDGDKDSD